MFRLRLVLALSALSMAISGGSWATARTGPDLNARQTVLVSQVNFVSDYEGAHLLGVVTNTGSDSIPEVLVYGALFNANGGLISVTGAWPLIGELAPEDTASFLVSFPPSIVPGRNPTYAVWAVPLAGPLSFSPPPSRLGPVPPGSTPPPPPWPTMLATGMPILGVTRTPFPTFTPLPLFPHVQEALAPIADCLNLALTYDASDALDPWKLYDKWAVVFANDLNYMIPGRGYWLRVNCDTTLTYEGRSARVRAGWNLIGWPP